MGLHRRSYGLPPFPGAPPGKSKRAERLRWEVRIILRGDIAMTSFLPVAFACGSRLRAGAGVVLLLHSLGCALPTPAPPPPARSVASSYAVGPPDVLLITVLPEPVIERSVTVRPDGMISLDLIGDVPAQGRTVAEIAADIESRMARFKRGANASVALASAQAHVVTVLGEVGSQTTVPLNREMRVAEMIGLVGGPMMFASERNIRVIRSVAGETTVYKVNLRAITGGDLSTNIELAGGDLIYVPPTPWARFGYAVNALFFPLQPFLGLGRAFAGSFLANAIN